MPRGIPGRPSWQFVACAVVREAVGAGRPARSHTRSYIRSYTRSYTRHRTRRHSRPASPSPPPSYPGRCTGLQGTVYFKLQSKGADTPPTSEGAGGDRTRDPNLPVLAGHAGLRPSAPRPGCRPRVQHREPTSRCVRSWRGAGNKGGAGRRIPGRRGTFALALRL